MSLKILLDNKIMKKKKRVLIVDDNESIHEDFKKILQIDVENQEIEEMEKFLFDEHKPAPKKFEDSYEIDDAYQGEEAIEMVKKAIEEDWQYSLVYMDVRMPPGMNGIDAIEQIWKINPFIEVVICTAYSDYSWDEIVEKLGGSDKLLFIKKPFNVIAIKQLTLSLTTKWEIAKRNREYMSHLEKEVEERTRELKKLLAHMKELKEKAEESDRLKSAFLANMSHEIRTPMNSILGFSQLLEEDPDIPPETRSTYIQYINNNGISLLHLINDIIDIAKIQAGQLKVSKSNFRLDEILEELHEAFSSELKKDERPEVEIIYNKQPGQEEVVLYSDPLRYRQIMNNLLNNAFKFTQKGSIEYGFTVDNGHLLHHVKDTGIGIPEDKLGLIFERFGQVETEGLNRSGTGLGLTITKNLIEMLGGKIWLISEPNVGTCFYFTIPMEKIDEGLNPPSSKSRKIIIPDLSNRIILIAEDEEKNYFFLKEALRKTRAELLWAKDGEEAIEMIIKNQHIDLAILDIKMPRISGIDVMKLIKRDRSSIPVVAQTAYAMEEERQQFMDIGFDDYLPKPIDLKLLYHTLNKWVK